MDLMTTADAGLFAPAVQPVLDRYPVTANVLATVLGSALSGASTFDDPLWLLLSQDGAPVGAGMNTLPRFLLLTPVPDGTADEAAGLVCAEFARQGRALDVVAGTPAEAGAFARAWSAQTGRRAVTAMSQRMYELVELSTARPVRSGAAGQPGAAGQSGADGVARLAGADDLPLLEEWFEQFHAEAEPHGPRGNPEVLRARVRQGLVVLWIDAGTPVSMAGFNHASAGVARIGPVYTPPEHRRRGYAGAVTAAASQTALDRGAQRCMLYTDLANPTSNGVYQRLGYTPVADAIQYRFLPPAG